MGNATFEIKVHVEEGKEDKGKVFRAYRASGCYDDDESEGVELPEREEAGFR